jgi:hypothetical protein
MCLCGATHASYEQADAGKDEFDEWKIYKQGPGQWPLASATATTRVGSLHFPAMHAVLLELSSRNGRQDARGYRQVLDVFLATHV